MTTKEELGHFFFHFNKWEEMQPYERKTLEKMLLRKIKRLTHIANNAACTHVYEMMNCADIMLNTDKNIFRDDYEKAKEKYNSMVSELGKVLKEHTFPEYNPTPFNTIKQ